MLRMTPVALALSVAWSFVPITLRAQSQALDDAKVIQLKKITVTSTRSEREIDDAPNTVSVIPLQKIEQNVPRDLKDLLSDELDVSVRTAPTRFTAAGVTTGRAGVEGINIRGLEGNQVLMLVDGIRVPNSFSFASFATGRGDYVDVDGLQSVEVLRGAASTQFGSDGLAGAVSFQTLNPADLLQNRNQHNQHNQPNSSKPNHLAGFARSSYSNSDKSWNNALAVAGQNERWQGLLLGSYRQGHETQNKGENGSLNESRTKPNPVDYNNRYLLGKAILKIDFANQLGLTFETQRRKQNTEVYSARAQLPSPRSQTLDLDTQDQMDRNRLSVEHRFDDLDSFWIQKAQTKVYWQDAKINQFSTEDRQMLPDRTRENTYTTQIAGISSVLETHLKNNGLFSAFSVSERITYGFDWSQSKITGLRDGSVPPFGEVFPTKPFPDATFTQMGVFVQNEIESETLSVIPSLRLDDYQLKPSLNGYNSSESAITLSDQAITPRLGLVWRLDSFFSPYAQWSKGFRSPTPDQVNNGFSNLSSGYTSIGNPNLKAERANSIEIGLRGKTDRLRYSLSAFNNQYNDFISQQIVSGSGTPSDPLVFQYINLSKAFIKGFEARSEWTLNKNWMLNAGFAYAKGESEANAIKTPLDTINPLKAVWGVRYDEAKWSARANVTHSQAKNANRVGFITSLTGEKITQFTPPSYTVLDLGVQWKPAHNLSVHANLNNVFDAKYWRWSDVRGLADDSQVKDAYTAQGRNFQVSVRYDF